MHILGVMQRRGMNAAQILAHIKKGHVMSIQGAEDLPPGFTRIVADLVTACCCHEPVTRPTFSDILYILDFVLEPNRALGLGKAIPASVWKMLERTQIPTSDPEAPPPPGSAWCT